MSSPADLLVTPDVAAMRIERLAFTA